MSVHDPRATLRQIQDAARRLQMICTGKTLAQLLADWQATARWSDSSKSSVKA